MTEDPYYRPSIQVRCGRCDAVEEKPLPELEQAGWSLRGEPDGGENRCPDCIEALAAEAKREFADLLAPRGGVFDPGGQELSGIALSLTRLEKKLDVLLERTGGIPPEPDLLGDKWTK